MTTLIEKKHYTLHHTAGCILMWNGESIVYADSCYSFYSSDNINFQVVKLLLDLYLKLILAWTRVQFNKSFNNVFSQTYYFMLTIQHSW